MDRKTLKKNIRYICGDIAQECIFATHYMPGIDYAQFNEIVLDTARLQSSALRRVSVSFDKTPRDFESRNLYNKARREYYAKAYASLDNDFKKQLQSIVDRMNKALTAKKQ